ncbi:metallophosphoesterase [Edaphovirga cremea]|uniref:metallophosphoesterase n=1 Tax=Edaphovirga cremea TaxID=2267246 RepID=UPI003988E433
MYQKIEGGNYRHIFVVGDLHGCFKMLLATLEEHDFDRENDLLISVGDLIDRGENSLECLALLEQPWFCAVLGNHEQMAIEALFEGQIENWLINGGNWYLALEDEPQIEAARLISYCRTLPLIIELIVDDKRTIIAHADYPADRYYFNKPVNREDVVWNRRRVHLALHGKSKPIAGADLFIFGHTPLQTPFRVSNQLYLDTGAVFGGYLTLHRLK